MDNLNICLETEFDLPVFNSTEEALSYGQSAWPDQEKKAEIQKCRNLFMALYFFTQITDNTSFDIAIAFATKAQFYREACERFDLIGREKGDCNGV